MFWSVGYYPAGVRGVGPPGAMFVMSTEDWWGGTWYTPSRKAVPDQKIELWQPKINRSRQPPKTQTRCLID